MDQVGYKSNNGKKLGKYLTSYLPVLKRISACLKNNTNLFYTTY